MIHFLILFAAITESILPSMDSIYTQDLSKKINKKQKELMADAAQKKGQSLRVMTYNMLYNAPDAEAKLPAKHRWEMRRPRLLEYLAYAKADIIGSQELQQDQIVEVMQALGDTYGYYGVKTRQNEGRTDTNAIFFNKNRIELLDAKTIGYQDPASENGFSYCYFRDKLTDKKFIALNTKLSWGSPDRRLAEATQLNEFSHLFQEPVIVLGDFNIYPCMLHKLNIFLDGEFVEQALMADNLKDAKSRSVFGHFGPLCSINNSKDNLEPFAGPQLSGFILDHIYVNDHVDVFTHGIDIAKASGEYPSDHFPVIAEIVLRED